MILIFSEIYSQEQQYYKTHTWHFKLFGYSIFWLLEYLMKVITETYRLYYITYQRSYCDPFEQSIHNQDNAMFSVFLQKLPLWYINYLWNSKYRIIITVHLIKGHVYKIK